MTLESICPLPAVSKYTVDPKVIIFHPDYVEKVLEPLPPYGLFTLWTPLEVSEFHPLFSFCLVSLDDGTRFFFPYP